MPDQSTLIKRDRRGRVVMTTGALWWWILGMVLVTAAGAIPIMMMAPHDPTRRWIGGAFAVAFIGYSLLMLRYGRSRLRAYRAELARRGLTHGRSTS